MNTTAATFYCCDTNNCNTPNTEVINSQVTSCYDGGLTAGVTVTPVQVTCPLLPANSGSYMCAV